jgi:hypothetical protein
VSTSFGHIKGRVAATRLQIHIGAKEEKQFDNADGVVSTSDMKTGLTIDVSGIDECTERQEMMQHLTGAVLLVLSLLLGAKFVKAPEPPTVMDRIIAVVVLDIGLGSIQQQFFDYFGISTRSCNMQTAVARVRVLVIYRIVATSDRMGHIMMLALPYVVEEFFQYRLSSQIASFACTIFALVHSKSFHSHESGSQ